MLLAWIAGGAAALLLGATAVVGLVVYDGFAKRDRAGRDQQKSTPVDPALGQTRAAALDFARQSGAHYLGRLTTTDGSQLPVDLTVTNAGTTRGRMGAGAARFDILATGGRTFFSARTTFWKEAGATASRAARYAGRWVRIEGGYIGIDPEQRLAPSILSDELLKAANTGEITAAPTDKNGVSARPITIPQGTIYVSTEAPYRVVHVDTRTTREPGGGLTPAAYAAEASFELDVSYPSETAAKSLFLGLKSDVSRLIGAIDSQVDFDLDGSVALSPCSARRCTARATLSNTLRGSDSYIRTDQPVIVEVIVAFTLDGKPIRSCTDTVTMAPNGKANTSCSVSYRLPADGSRHTIRAAVSGFAKALSTADVAVLSSDLAKQPIGWRVRQAGGSGLPDASTRHGRYQFRPPAGFNPIAGRLAETGDGYLDAAGNLWTQTSAQGLAAKRGFTHEWRVKLSDQGLVEWKSSAKQGKSKDGWFLNVTPHGDIAH